MLPMAPRGSRAPCEMIPVLFSVRPTCTALLASSAGVVDSVSGTMLQSDRIRETRASAGTEAGGRTIMHKRTGRERGQRVAGFVLASAVRGGEGRGGGGCGCGAG